jgi:hypothetical protein
MRIVIGDPAKTFTPTVIDPGVQPVTMTETFLGVTFVTTEGARLSVCMRDDGYEVHYYGDTFDAGWTEFKWDGAVQPTADHRAPNAEDWKRKAQRLAAERDALAARLSALTAAIGDPDDLRTAARYGAVEHSTASVALYRIAAAVQPPESTPPPTDHTYCGNCEGIDPASCINADPWWTPDPDSTPPPTDQPRPVAPAMTPAEQFDKACDERWANDPNRHLTGRPFYAAACEVYMQEHNLHWGRDLSGFSPDDMKMLGRWLAKCEKGRNAPDGTVLRSEGGQGTPPGGTS